VTVANELRRGNKAMSDTATVSSAPDKVCNGIRKSTMSEGNLLEELRVAYQQLRHEERQQVKNLLLTLSRSSGHLTERRQNDGKSRNHR
jgi:hypothetical protein